MMSWVINVLAVIGAYQSGIWLYMLWEWFVFRRKGVNDDPVQQYGKPSGCSKQSGKHE
jgi:hypothetical protein